MQGEPVIVRVTEQHIAVVPIVVPRAELGAVIDAAVHELMAVLAAQGVAPRGPLLAYHHRTDAEVFDFEFGVPVDAGVVPSGRVRPGGLPAATVAQMLYRGPYDGLATAWHELRAWARANAHVAADDFWARYVRGPETGAEPSSWVTELNLRLLR